MCMKMYVYPLFKQETAKMPGQLYGMVVFTVVQELILYSMVVNFLGIWILLRRFVIHDNL